MKSIFALIFSSAVLATTLFASAAFAQDSGADHDHHSAHELELSYNDGHRWATDESLRKGMASIRQAFRSRLPDFREQSLEADQYKALAGRVEDQLAFMFNNCDLPPEADAELHKLLAFVTGTVSHLRSDGERRNGMMSLHNALNAYPEYFDHPGWGE